MKIFTSSSGIRWNVKRLLLWWRDGDVKGLISPVSNTRETRTRTTLSLWFEHSRGTELVKSGSRTAQPHFADDSLNCRSVYYVLSSFNPTPEFILIDEYM